MWREARRRAWISVFGVNCWKLLLVPVRWELLRMLISALLMAVATNVCKGFRYRYARKGLPYL